METLVLSMEDVRHIVERVGLDALMDEMIARLTAALQNYDESTTVAPARGGFAYSQPESGLLEWMPVMERGGHVTIKVVGYHPCNPCLHQLPTILSTISVYDTASGHLLGLADGTFVTALRTGAASAVASRALAKPGSRVLGLIGCGAQAVTQFHALSRVFSFARVLLYDLDPAIARSFPARAAFVEEEIEMRPAALDELTATADIICTATSVEVGRGPVFPDTAVSPHLHLNAVGSDFPGKTEIPLSLLRRSFVCPDFPQQAIHEGECQQLTPDEIGPDLAEVVQNAPDYAGVQGQLSVFDSTGFALEDQAAMEMLLDYAAQLGLGTPLLLESTSADPHNPYQFGDGRG